MDNKRAVHRFRLEQVLEYCRQDVPIDRILVCPHWLQMDGSLKWQSAIKGELAPLFDKFPTVARDCVISLYSSTTAKPNDIKCRSYLNWLRDHGFATRIHGRDGYQWALTMLGGMLWESNPRRLAVEQKPVEMAE